MFTRALSLSLPHTTFSCLDHNESVPRPSTLFFKEHFTKTLASKPNLWNGLKNRFPDWFHIKLVKNNELFLYEVTFEHNAPQGVDIQKITSIPGKRHFFRHLIYKGPVLFKTTDICWLLFESCSSSAEEWELIVRFAAVMVDVCNEVLRKRPCEIGLSFQRFCGCHFLYHHGLV